MNILVTLDRNYLGPLKVMLFSLFTNNPKTNFDIYVMHDSLSKKDINNLNRTAAKFNSKIIDVKIDEKQFSKAPILLHYTKAMYFRLLAQHYLPKSLSRVIYIDPDILVLNKLDALYNMNIGKYYYAAAYHKLFSSKTLNKIRLYPYKIKNYYNSGVLLLNLRLLRKDVSEELIFGFVEKNKSKLVMPDQDVLNSLFAKKIKLIDEVLYNYDARHYNVYLALSGGEFDLDKVVNKTVFLHFCGKRKPWHPDYSSRFSLLYKHYQRQLSNLS
jgi:lipopolysaccharide biosynthesis glycosyltransferase